MKKIFTILIILAGGLIFMSFTVPKESGTTTKQNSNLIIPKGAHALIMQHCYMCHNSKSRDIKPKKKLNFDLLAQMPLPGLVGKLQGIHDVVAKGKMPPQKFLEHHPDKALSAKDKSLLENWAVATADSLMKNK